MSTRQDDQIGWVSLNALASRYGCSPDFWRRQAATGKVRAMRLGRKWVVDANDLVRFEMAHVYSIPQPPSPAITPDTDGLWRQALKEGSR